FCFQAQSRYWSRSIISSQSGANNRMHALRGARRIKDGSGSAERLRHAMQHDILLAKFEPRVRPGLDVLSQRLRPLFPIVAVHAAVGLWESLRVAHGIEPQSIAAVAHDQLAKRLE